jgi:outer membrane lipoprotein-sorting protein
VRICVLLVLMAGLLFAADPPNDDRPTNEAEKLFRTMEQKLAKAKTLECVFDVKTDAVSYHGSLYLDEGNRARLEINEATKDRTVRVLMVSDGVRQSFQDNGMSRPQLGDTLKNLNAEILTWVARPGVFLPQAPLPDVKTDDAKDRFRVTDFTLGQQEKVRERDAQRLGYRLAVKGQDDPFLVDIWLDLKTGLPVKRQITSRAGVPQTAVVETYGKLGLDEKVDVKKFDLPK